MRAERGKDEEAALGARGAIRRSGHDDGGWRAVGMTNDGSAGGLERTVLGIREVDDDRAVRYSREDLVAHEQVDEDRAGRIDGCRVRREIGCSGCVEERSLGRGTG